MTDTEQKALALVNEVLAEYPLLGSEVAAKMALCRAIKQHEAFRQEVSEAIDSSVLSPETEAHLCRFITKPVDPLVEAWRDQYPHDPLPEQSCELLREALAARGLEIREKG